jgi:pimeloyl-ACP methyl ester carboxylesterase
MVVGRVLLAATMPVRRVVLVTPFDSILALARRLFPFLPVRLLLADPFESVKDAPRIAVPTLVIMAGADVVVPSEHTRRLLAAFRDGVAEAIEFPRAGHDDVSLNPRFYDEIRRFLAP